MQIMGNSKARAVYEANVPEGFRRPQTDSQLDVFIRAKYEKKKYIAREWVPTKAPELPEGWTALIEAEKQKKDIRSIVLPSHTKDSKEEIVKRFCICILVYVYHRFHEIFGKNAQMYIYYQGRQSVPKSGRSE